MLNVKYNFGVEDLYEPAEEYWNDFGKFKVKMPPPAPPPAPPSSKSNAKKNKSNKKENKGKSRDLNLQS